MPTWLREYRYKKSNKKLIPLLNLVSSKSLTYYKEAKTRKYGTAEFPYLPGGYFHWGRFESRLRPVKMHFQCYRLSYKKKIMQKRLHGLCFEFREL
jgi:hypothetical protein